MAVCGVENPNMNASPLSSSTAASGSGAGTPRLETKVSRTRRPWIFSLTGVCFIFGGLLAMQLRATQQINANHKLEKAGIAEANLLATKMKAQADAGIKERAKMSAAMVVLRDQLAKNGKLTVTQVAALNAQLKDLQTVAGLTPFSGPGVRITLSDNAAVVQNAGDPGGAALPGLVHDFDLQQVVNELRLAKAEAIAINGQRITGYSPIRCVGSPIMINWETVTSPYVIDAVGNPATLRSALEMPAGIVDQMRNNGGINVKVEGATNLKLPAATGGVPKIRVAKVIP